MGKEFIKEIKLKKLFIVFILMSIIAFSQVKSDIVKMKNIAESKSFFDLGIQHIASMSVDSLGNLFIIDGMKRKILKFDTKLKYISSFGKQGQGPGEFNRAYTISIDKKRSREAPFYILIAEMGLISAFASTLWTATNFQALLGRHFREHFVHEL